MLAQTARLSPSLTSTFGCPISPGCPTAGGYSKLHYPWLHYPAGGLPSCPLTSAFEPEPLSNPPSSALRTGSYIAFALATESIAGRFPADSNAREAIRVFPAGRYTGLVTSVFTYTDEDGKIVEDLVVHYVARMKPKLPSAQDHWVAIADSHAGERTAPLRTTVFFPWVDGKQWTTLGIRLRVERVHDSSLHFTLEDEEFSRFEDIAVVDYDDMNSSEAQLSVEETEQLQKWSVPSFAVPAEIWRDIRICDGVGEPSAFVDEMHHLERLLEAYSGTD